MTGLSENDISKARILVVDDEETKREIILSILRSAGFECREAANGLQALQLLRAGEKFDLMLTDTRRDGLDGIGLLERTRVEFPEMPVVMVGPRHDIKVIVIGLRKGAYDYSLYPFKDKKELLVSVHRTLEDRAKKEHEVQQGYMPLPPDFILDAALQEHLSFLFRGWHARIVQNQQDTVVIECGSFLLKTIREREFLAFFIAPKAHPHSWENADIAIAAATDEAPRHEELLDVCTSLPILARVLIPRVGWLWRAFSSEHISRTEEVIAQLRQQEVGIFRSSSSRHGVKG